MYEPCYTKSKSSLTPKPTYSVYKKISRIGKITKTESKSVVSDLDKEVNAEYLHGFEISLGWWSGDENVL